LFLLSKFHYDERQQKGAAINADGGGDVAAYLIMPREQRANSTFSCGVIGGAATSVPEARFRSQPFLSSSYLHAAIELNCCHSEY
jgi:hypothetical protein